MQFGNHALKYSPAVSIVLQLTAAVDVWALGVMMINLINQLDPYCNTPCDNPSAQDILEILAMIHVRVKPWLNATILGTWRNQFAVNMIQMIVSLCLETARYPQ
jgi:serine/threonine protein kinase